MNRRQYRIESLDQILVDNGVSVDPATLEEIADEFSAAIGVEDEALGYCQVDYSRHDNEIDRLTRKFKEESDRFDTEIHKLRQAICDELGVNKRYPNVAVINERLVIS